MTVFLAILCLALVGAVVVLALKLGSAASEIRNVTLHSTDRARSSLVVLERDQRRADEIIDQMAEGVMMLDSDLTPLMANGAARTMLGLQRKALPDRLPSGELREVVEQALAEDSAKDEVIDVWYPARLSLRIRVAPLDDRGGLLVMIDDVSEELRTQRIRREFVAHASHELKSPVASLHALAEAVREAVEHDATAVRRFSDQLVGEADRLGRLIRDLLDLSRLEEGSGAPDTAVDLSDVARRSVATLEEEAEAKELRLGLASTGSVWVRGDEQQLGLMIGNLLSNALNYTPAGGRVTIEVSTGRGEALTRVSDTGIGIPVEAQSRIFERFYRVDPARSRATGGTGLGLAIVKHIVELHGGRIELDSEIGRGSTFTVRLPGADERTQIHSVAG